MLDGDEGWFTAPGNLIRDPDAVVGVPDDVAASARAGEASTLRLGWPLLVQKVDHGVRLVPLLVLEVDVTAGESPRLVPVDEGPLLNPRLGDAGLGPEDVAALQQVFAEGRDGPVTELAAALAAALGVACEPLDGPHHPPRPGEGVQNAAIVEQLQDSVYTVHLREELQQVRDRTDWKDTVAAALVLGRVPALPAQPPARVVSPVPLNDSQWDAVRAIGDAVTVVTGPPGTGKSQVVTAAVATAWDRGWTSLVTSTNNGAVDVAVARLHQTHPVLALRSGNRDHRERLAATAGDLVRAPATAGPRTPRADLELTAAHDSLAASVAAATERSEAQVAYLEAVQGLDAVTEPVLDRGHDLDPHARASVATVAALARRDRLGWWRRCRLRRLRRRLALRRQATTAQVGAWAEAWLLRDQARARLASAAGPLEPAAVAEAEAAWQRTSAARLSEIASGAITGGRGSLQRLSDARPRGNRPLAERDDLAHLRGWAVTALSVRRTLPLTAGVVDLLVLDEASQCSLAHVLPLAYRAKRAFVLGDPNQLRPVLTLDAEQEARAARAAGIDLTAVHERGLSMLQDSAFDAFRRTVPQVHALLEHYRCHPQIAGWFNREFYNDSLTVLTAVDPLLPAGIQAEPVPGGTVRRGRPSSWVNDVEIARVVELAGPLAEQGDSVGIVTPFRGQARAIQAALADAYGSDWMTRHDVAVATAHRFQGAERDVMVFSTVVTPDMGTRTARWLESERRLVNVAASRAKRQLVVVGDPDATRAHGLLTLGSLWDAAAEDATAHRLPDDTWTPAELALWQAADGRLPGLEGKLLAHGYPVDLAWRTPWQLDVDIEVDDDAPGGAPRRRREDLARDRSLNGLGWHVARVPGWLCLREPDRAVDLLLEVLPAVQEPGTTDITADVMTVDQYRWTP